MGIPAAFRWLSNRYPKIISPVVEDLPVVADDGTTIPVDTTRSNPNGEEFDNLYLDMNGIVHPCSHPEDRPAPKDEEEMMHEIFRYTDRVVNMVRPRKILMIAVDGVAPRAKMNQQRSRRFRSAQEAQEKEEDKKELLKLLKQQNGGAISEQSTEEVVKKTFDSNSITPGTPFMDILAKSLRYWCQYKLNTDPGWATLKIIISDATVPGEGEHKIMDFVRSQRASPDHDPNTRHVIYGLDADLIMLGLATHEAHFRVLREDVFFQQEKARMCKICGQKGHEARDCRGEAKEKSGEFDEKDSAPTLKPFIWLHVPVLREYLAIELAVPGLPFRFDLERAIDDWIFMCCFVGNDFLPHLPALEIREDGINTLMAIWRDNLALMGGYVTKDGHIDLQRAQFILDGLAKQEDAIFRRRREQEERREANQKRRRLQENESNKGNKSSSRDTRGGHHNPANGAPLFPIGAPPPPPKALTHDQVVNQGEAVSVANKSAASVLKEKMRAAKAAEGSPVEEAGTSNVSPSALGKRKATELESSSRGTATPDAAAAGEDAVPQDNVRLWESGYQDRYYQQKFGKEPDDKAFRHGVAAAYVEGLAWVLQYYFQGCPSWEWYYPYHYAPFAADFHNIASLDIKFEKGRTSRPFEQLMSVLPAASRHAIPEIFHDLMLNSDSEIIDFYPEDFEIDLNGKKFAWQGVALLPFIDMPRLLAAVQSRYPKLSAEDQVRNSLGRDVLLLSDGMESLYDEIATNFYSKKQGAPVFKLNPKKSAGLAGKVEKHDDYIPHGQLIYPLDRKALPDVENDRSIKVYYDMPKTQHSHKSMLLRGAQPPAPALTRSDVEAVRGKSQRGGRGGMRGDRFSSRGGHRPSDYGGRGGYSSGGGAHNGGRPFQGDHRGGYNNGNGRGGGHYGGNDMGGPPRYNGTNSGWVPPPPGTVGFGMGGPPPPPAFYGSDNHFDHRGQARPSGGWQGGPQGPNRSNNGPPPPRPDGRGYWRDHRQ